MHDGFDVFKTYLAIKLHFTTDKYDFHSYSGKVNCKLDTFTKRNDRYFFHKLSKQYDKYEIIDFFVANFLDNDKQWVGNLLEKDGKTITENIQIVLITILELIAKLLIWPLLIVVFLLMMVYLLLEASIHACLNFFSQKE